MTDTYHPATTAWLMLFVAWLVALAATLGALFIGEVMGQAPCLLCWYQRIAMFPLALILGIGCLREDAGVRRYALPLALAGGAVALWHSLLYFGAVPKAIEPCGQGLSCTSVDMTILGVLPLPVLSFGAFAAIILLLILTKPKEQP
jgi:disulfide bond formation protein DsbB